MNEFNFPSGFRETIIENLLAYPPVEGSREAHEAWKQNVFSVMCSLGWKETSLLFETGSLYEEVRKPGYISQRCRREAKKLFDTLTEFGERYS